MVGDALLRRLGSRRTRRAFPRHRDPWCKGGTLVVLILDGNPHGNRLEALEPRGWLEVRALLATVERGVALRTSAGEIKIGRQGSRAVVTSGRGDMLDEARQPGAGYIEGRTGALRFRSIIAAEALAIPVGIHITVLSVLAIAFHWGRLLRVSRKRRLSETV